MTKDLRPTHTLKPEAPRFDDSVPNDDNESNMDMALVADAISDKLEYAVHRSGLTPRLKILMAALRRSMDIGDIKFKPTHRPTNLMLFLAEKGPLRVFPAAPPEPAYALPTPIPGFVRPYSRR